ncbi:MAG: hypothetical protein IT443_09230 [Phycisphaeraceae bacterium]|nr:hypothetical protein [Phycisphaeraceae bacterium]
MGMNSASYATVVRPSRVAPFRAARWFYPGAGVLMLIYVLIGFEQFYFHGRAYPDREITPPIRTLVIVHGLAMAAWIIVGIIQPTLVATGRRRLHMAIGPFAAALAAVILVLGLMIGLQSARVAPPGFQLMGFTAKQFMAVPLISVTVFAILVAVGIWQRKRPMIHRSMMLTATLVAMSAAINRIDALNNLYLGTIWDRIFGPFFFAVVTGGVLLLIRSVLIRAFDRWLAIGFGVLTLVSVFIVALARTQAWDSFASLLLP